MSDWAGSNTETCEFPKHKDRSWEDVVREDPLYVMWIMDDLKHDFTIDFVLYEILLDMLVEEGYDIDDIP